MTTKIQVPVFKTYTESELDTFRFLLLIVGTSGLDNPRENQTINYNCACPICKAGRQFEYPLKVPVNLMGKKRIDQNYRYGYIIIENNLVNEIKDSQLKGIDFKPAEMGRDLTNFQVCVISDELPRMSDRSVINKFETCGICGRSGHYSSLDKPDEFWYDKSILDKAMNDFYRTWEYFGIWDKGQTFQRIIVSQRTRQFLKRFKLRHIKFDPIFEL